MASRQPHALGRLIREVQQANGWSYADISANADQAGRSLSRSRVESLRNDPLTSIGIKAVESLAAGLCVPPARVVAAAVESMGYPPASSDQVGSAKALENDPMLNASTRRVLLAALEAAHDEYDRASGSKDPTGSKRRRGRSTRAVGGRIADIAADES